MKCKNLLTGKQEIYGELSVAQCIRIAAEAAKKEGVLRLLKPMQLVLRAMMVHPATENHVFQIPSIDNEIEARNSVTEMFLRMPAAESWARGRRAIEEREPWVYESSREVGDVCEFDESNWYCDYLASDWWQQKRQEAYRTYGRACFFCGGSSDLHVHHRHYNTLGRENVATDLSVFCKKHHSELHETSWLVPPNYPPQRVKEILGINS